MKKPTKRKPKYRAQVSVADDARRRELAAVRRAARMERQIAQESRRLQRLVEARENEMRALALFFGQRAEHVETMHLEVVTT